MTLGYVLLAQGKWAAAEEALTEVLRLAFVHGSRLFIASALEGLASMLTQTQNYTSAVRSLSVASALRAQMGASLRLVDVSLLHQTTLTLRAAIGDDLFKSIWVKAQVLSLEAIVSEWLSSRMP